MEPGAPKVNLLQRWKVTLNIGVMGAYVTQIF